jgi:hypothetical protein
METMIDAVVIRYRNAFSEALSELLLMTSLERSKTEGSEENLNRRQQRKQRHMGDWVSVMLIR